MNQLLKKMLLMLTTCSLVLLCTGCASESYESPETIKETEALEEMNTDITEVPETSNSSDVMDATESAGVDVKLETEYGTFTIPAEYAGHIQHREVIEGEIAMEIFSMIKENDTWELFRIYFGDPETGKKIGTLNVGEKTIAVTVAVCEYDSETFADEETEKLYAQTMDLLNHLLDEVRSDVRFVNQEDVVIQKEDEKLEYWVFSLPEGMEWEESVAEGDYSAVFYGAINGKKYALYTVAVGGTTLRTVLGTYTVDGIQKPVSIESYELPDTSDWAADAETELYIMMESINDVIDVIMSSENFSAEISVG